MHNKHGGLEQTEEQVETKQDSSEGLNVFLLMGGRELRDLGIRDPEQQKI